MTPQKARALAAPHLAKLTHFIGRQQLACLRSGLNGEECQYFLELAQTLDRTIAAMPATYATDGQGKAAYAYLHYFRGDSDWWITEKDIDTDNEGQLQAFGLASLGCNGNQPELGYICIAELIQHNVELDFHWKPKTLAELMGEDPPANTPPPISPTPPPNPDSGLSAHQDSELSGDDIPDIDTFTAWQQAKTQPKPKAQKDQPMNQRFDPIADTAPQIRTTPARAHTTAAPTPTKTKSKSKKPKTRRDRKQADPQEALARARASLSEANIPIILAAFQARGIPEHQILPRENVLTFNAWLALGRCVRKGEKSVHIPVKIIRGGEEKTDPETGQTITTPVRSFQWTAHVFHISQTDPITDRKGAAPSPTSLSVPESVRTAATFATLSPPPPILTESATPNPQSPSPKLGSWRAHLRKRIQ